jgi:hypothetical protein
VGASTLGRCGGGALVGKGFYPKTAPVEAPESGDLVNETTQSGPDLSG